MSVTLLHHRGAGEGEWTAETIVAALEEAGFDPVVVERGDKGWRKAITDSEELVIVAGGDGTVAKAAFLLAGTDVPLAILPTGSGNNIARSLDVMAPLEKIIPRLKGAGTTQLRLCRLKGPWDEDTFVEAIGLGALAQSVLELQEEKLDGDDKLIRGRDSLISAIEAQERLALTIEVDGQTIPGSFLLVEILNLAMIGPNLQLAPRTALRADNICVALLPERDRAEMVDWLVEGGAGVAPLLHVQGKKIEITGGPQPLRLDDKTRDWDGSRVRFRVASSQVQVLRPGEPR